MNKNKNVIIDVDVITFENQNETDSKQIYILDDSFLCKEMDLIENFELLQNVICLQTSLNILKTKYTFNSTTFHPLLNYRLQEILPNNS